VDIQKSESDGDEESLDQVEKSLREKALESLNRHKAHAEEDDEED
jgi:hypothetical protein